MLFSVIIPTLGIRIKELSRLLNSLQAQTYKHIQTIIVSQDNYQSVEKLIAEFPGMEIDHIKSDRKGLSAARNLAAKHIKGNIITYSDDDCWYPENSFQTVYDSFIQNPESDVQCFQIFDPEQEQYYKNYSDTSIERLTLRQLFQRSSIEIFILMDKVGKENLLFHEDFGLGAKYPSGEENILLANLYNKGFLLTYINKIVVYHAKPTQTSRLNLPAFKSKGPLFKQIFGSFLGFFMLTALFAKKISALEKPFAFYFAALREMFVYKRSSN